MFHCREQTITKISSAMMELPCNFKGSKSPFGHSNTTQRTVRHDIRGKKLFISIFYLHQILSIFKPEEFFPWINKDYLFIYYHGHMYTFINIAPFISRI